MRFLIPALAALVFVSQVVSAGETDDNKKRAKAKKDIETEMAKLNSEEYCGPGPKIEATVDFASFNTPESLDQVSQCAQFVGGVATACYGDADFREAVTKKVKSVVCHYDAKLKTPGTPHAVKSVFKNGKLDGYLNENSSNIYLETSNYLKKEAL